jgi:nucleoside recognition membrane protein YjiH
VDKSFQIGLDKTETTCYNTTMKNTIRKNEMIEKFTVALIIGSGVLAVVMCAITCAWILANTL